MNDTCSLKCTVCDSKYHLQCLSKISNSFFTTSMSEQWICIACCEDIFPLNHIKCDAEFHKCILDLFSYKNSEIDLDNQMFNPFELNNIDRYLSQYDPDVQYFKDINYDCKYYLEHTFTQSFTSRSMTSNNISLLHLNIRSSVKNLNNFELYINNLDFSFNVIGLSETWIKEHNCALLELNGYNSRHVYRPRRVGGGVSLYIKNNINYLFRNDLSILEDCIESVFIEISNQTQIFRLLTIIL